MIEASDLCFSYPGSQQPALNGFSGMFNDGTISALVGRSGSGKSTLLYLLGLLTSPTSGSLIHDGIETSHLDDGGRSRLRATTMGFVFQDALLDPARTVIDNVMEGGLFGQKHPDHAWATELLTSFEVDVAHDRRPGQISGGQAQRVALCRALYCRPSLVLADEPTGNLDRETSDLVWKTLHDLAAEGRTVIVATHDIARGEYCDQVIRLGRH